MEVIDGNVSVVEEKVGDGKGEEVETVDKATEGEKPAKTRPEELLEKPEYNYLKNEGFSSEIFKIEGNMQSSLACSSNSSNFQ
jgi:hypothetical protein